MYPVFVVSIIIIIIVLFLAVITTSKAYSFKHTVDPIDDNPHVDKEQTEVQEENKA